MKDFPLIEPFLIASGVPTILKTVKMSMYTRQQCEVQRKETIDPGMLCVGAPQGVQLADACKVMSTVAHSLRQPTHEYHYF